MRSNATAYARTQRSFTNQDVVRGNFGMPQPSGTLLALQPGVLIHRWSWSNLKPKFPLHQSPCHKTIRSHRRSKHECTLQSALPKTRTVTVMSPPFCFEKIVGRIPVRECADVPLQRLVPAEMGMIQQCGKVD